MGTLSNELSAILDDIDDSYAALAEQGAALPAAENQGTSQLPDTIATIPHPKLQAPSISRSNGTISISNPSANGNFVTGYAVYNGNIHRGNISGSSFALSGLGAGTYELSVKARGTNFDDSDKSNVIKASVYTIARTLTNLTANNSTAFISNGLPYTVTLTPASGYYLPEDITVTMGGKAYTTWFCGTAPIYGVSGLYASAPALTRTDDAEGMSFEINSSSGAITSDFNDVFPWSVAEVVDDDAGKFVSFPEMYFRIGTDSNSRITDVAVSAQPSNEGEWYKVDPFMYGCYGASVVNNKMRSVSGAERTNLSRANYRARAFDNGEGYIPIDLYHRNVLMLLWWIEFATKKSDSIMTGRIAYSGTSGGSSRRPCGGTDSVPTPSGFETAYAQMRYHFIEDFIGNVWEMVDGIYLNNVGQQDYVTADPTKFSETTDGKNALPWVNPANQEIAAYGWDPDNPFLFMPIEVVNNGSYNTYFCDQVYHAAGNPVMLAGARYYDSNAYCGLSYVNGTDASDYNARYGSRLLKIS